MPGVYLFKDAKGRVLYVGKADVLRDRVRAYFGPTLEVRHIRMVERAERLEYVLTDSISEAFLLESNLIKQHHPRYNIRLKDDKSYPYVKVTLGEDVLFLEGRYEALARDTKKEMQQASDALAFERAATLRDRLVAIERTLDRQEVHAYKGDDFDVHAAAVEEGDAVVQVFRVRDGTVVSRDHFSLEGSEGALAPDVLAS